MVEHSGRQSAAVTTAFKNIPATPALTNMAVTTAFKNEAVTTALKNIASANAFYMFWFVAICGSRRKVQ